MTTLDERSREPVGKIAPRDIDFELDPAHIADWIGGSKPKTVFVNALSLMFPQGERFFINSVAHYRARITDPALKADVAGFVSQEALHTREHIAYNDAMATTADVARLDHELGEHFAYVKRIMPPLACLAATAALEHFTAIMAKELLDDPVHLAEARSDYKRLWVWHALEECEHKAVAYDVFQTVTEGKKSWMRRRVMALTTITFLRFIAKHTIALMRAEGIARSPAAWATLLWFVFGKPGIMRRILGPYLAYYRASFHPNDIDDRSTLERTRRDVAAWNATPRGAAG